MFLQRLLSPALCNKISTLSDVLRHGASALTVKFIHTSPVNHGLMDFFDNEKNWGANRVFVGRAWKMEELRIKSNSDLHKLWYVLLKEKNMLFTMEHESRERGKLFPNPERIDKVLESMHNLEEVVRERNRAYHLLETGETGERPGKMASNAIGMWNFYKMREHIVPKDMNQSWRGKYKFYYGYGETRDFISLYKEKLWNAKRKARNRERNHVRGLKKRFPNIDVDHLKELYPDIDVDRALESDKAISHRAED